MSGLLNPPGRICGCEWCDRAVAVSEPGAVERVIRETYPGFVSFADRQEDDQ